MENELIPTSIKGKELEELVLFRARKCDEPQGLYTVSRCGVMSFFNKGVWTPVHSLPDMGGITADGREFVFDCKVCSQASYDLSGGTHKSFAHQLKYMRKRAKFGATCFILMHFNERILKTRSDPSFTVLFPIGETAFWLGYDEGSQKNITRTEAELYGIAVSWDSPGKKRKLSPNLYAALCALRQENKHKEE